MEGPLCLSILFRQVFEDHSYYFCCCWIHSLVAIPHELGHSDKKSRIRMQYILVTKLCIIIRNGWIQVHLCPLWYLKFHLFFFYCFLEQYCLTFLDQQVLWRHREETWKRWPRPSVGSPHNSPSSSHQVVSGVYIQCFKYKCKLKETVHYKANRFRRNTNKCYKKVKKRIYVKIIIKEVSLYSIWLPFQTHDEHSIFITFNFENQQLTCMVFPLDPSRPVTVFLAALDYSDTRVAYHCTHIPWQTPRGGWT